MEVALACWLGAWLMLSAVGQVLPRQTRLRRAWFAWCIPEWRFFAPEPCTYDYALLFRAQRDLDRLATVHLAELSRWRWAWHPSGRRQKIFRDLCDVLQIMAREASSKDDKSDIADGVCLSDPYLLLLNFCLAQADEDGLIQFGIIRSVPGADDEIVFVSRWHSRNPVAAEPLAAA